MYYGIDLGTTNSLIGSGTTLYSGLVSSNVDVDTKKQVPKDAMGDHIITSYKVNMTTGKEGELPIACSAIVLKELADKASERAGEIVKDVVVSVPAKFSVTQREAVYLAAKQAGLTVRGLVNEPTAAAIYVCNKRKDLVAVFDLGGGTFDITLIDSRLGNYTVLATDGKILAGDDFDSAIADYIYDKHNIKIRFKSKRLTQKLMYDIKLAKEMMQRTGLTQYLDLTLYGCAQEFELSKEIYVTIMKEVFEPTITLTKHLIQTYLPSSERPKLVLVGGSTACPMLTEWIKEELRLDVIECDEIPDLIVAKGVALYAEMLYEGSAQQEIEDVTKRLCIEDDKGRAITVIDKNTIIPIEQSIQVYNSIESETLEINLYQGDSILCARCTYIGTLVYNYGMVKKAGEGYVEIKVHVDRNELVSLIGIDILTGDEQKVNLVMK